MNKKLNVNKNSGFTLFIAIVVMGTLLLVATGIVNLAVRQSHISVSGRESQIAFYAADSGMECALFWDVGSLSASSAFDTTSENTITCNQDALNPDNQWVVGGEATSVIDLITFNPASHCATVTVTKNPDGSTTIESRGYNTCDPDNARRVERAVRATY
ncbi:MAG: PilX N-terminal domain-containing pilus assembly protein [Parcubacteria group bacterium]